MKFPGDDGVDGDDNDINGFYLRNIYLERHLSPKRTFLPMWNEQ